MGIFGILWVFKIRVNTYIFKNLPNLHFKIESKQEHLGDIWGYLPDEL